MKSKLRQIASPQLSSSTVDPDVDGVQNNISITGNRLNFVGGEDDDNLYGRLDAEETNCSLFKNSDANEFKECAGKDSLPVTGKLIEDDRNLTDDAATVTAEMCLNSGDGLEDKLPAGYCIYSTGSTTTASHSEKVTLDVSADDPRCTSVDTSARNPTDAFQADGSTLPSPGSAALVGKCPASAEERVGNVSASRNSPDDRVADCGPQLSVTRSFSFNVSNECVGNHSQLVEDDVYRSLDNCEAVTWQHLATDSNSLDVDSFNSEDVTLDSLMGQLAAMLFRKVSIVQSYFLWTILSLYRLCIHSFQQNAF